MKRTRKTKKTNKITPAGKARGPGHWQFLMKTQCLPTDALVYEVRAADGKGQAVTVSYNGVHDPSGMMYIGELADTDRVNDLLKGFHNGGKPDPHGAATKYFKEGLDKIYPVDQLEIRVTLVDQSAPADSRFSGLFDKPAEQGKPPAGKVAARVNERGLLLRFEQQYKRLPPLNKKKGYHTKAQPLAQSPGEHEVDGVEPVHMEPISDDQLQKAKAGSRAIRKSRGNNS